MLQTLSKYSHLILIVLVLGAVWGYGCENRRAGRLQERAAVAEERVTARNRVIAALVTAARPVDTVPVARWFTRWDTLRVTDTLDLSDTTKVRRLILTADSTIKECRRLTQDCVTQIANRDQTISLLAQDTVDLREKLKAVEAQRPNWVERRFGCTAGVAATTKGAGLGASCGIRFP